MTKKSDLITFFVVFKKLFSRKDGGLMLKLPKNNVFEIGTKFNNLEQL